MASGGSAGGGGGGVESWKRAAEVTSQLKARIEQMKVCSPLDPVTPFSHLFPFLHIFLPAFAIEDQYWTALLTACRRSKTLRDNEVDEDELLIPWFHWAAPACVAVLSFLLWLVLGGFFIYFFMSWGRLWDWFILIHISLLFSCSSSGIGFYGLSCIGERLRMRGM